MGSSQSKQQTKIIKQTANCDLLCCKIYVGEESQIIIDYILKQNQSLRKQIQLLRSSFQQYKKQVSKSSQQNSPQKLQKVIFAQPFPNQQIKIMQLVNQNKNLKAQKTKLSGEIYTLFTKNQNQKKDLHIQMNKMKQQLSKKDSQLKKLKQQSIKKEKQITLIQQQSLNLKNKIRKCEKEIFQKQKFIDQLNNKLQDISRKLQQREQRIDNLKKDILQSTNNLSNANLKLQQKQKDITTLKQAIPSAQARVTRLFQGSILQYQQAQKEYLIEELQRRIGSTIIKTNLLYTFDKNNKTNFHKYIDDKNPIIIIIKTESDYIFGGYSQVAFSKKVASRGRGYIFSSTNRNFFQLNAQNNKPISYDDNYLIFGNSQIRIKHLQNIVYSNFGISNSYYNSKGNSTKILYGTDKKEQKIKSYQIYSLQTA